MCEFKYFKIVVEDKIDQGVSLSPAECMCMLRMVNWLASLPESVSIESWEKITPHMRLDMAYRWALSIWRMEKEFRSTFGDDV